MSCDHDNRDRVLVIRHASGLRAELWRCRDCGEYIASNPTTVRNFLRENPAPCLEVHDGSALVGIDADDLRTAPQHGGPLADADSIPTTIAPGLSHPLINPRPGLT